MSIFSWFKSSKSKPRPEVPETRDPTVTVGDALRSLAEVDQDSFLVVSNHVHLGWDTHVERIASEMLVESFHPIRYAHKDDPEYVYGANNKVRDETVPKLVLIRIGSYSEMHPNEGVMPPRNKKKPLRVRDLMTALSKFDEDLLLVDSGHENAYYTTNARNIGCKEHTVLRKTKPGERGYVEGMDNKIPDTPKRVSFFVNSTDFSQYCFD